ncbi:MAG TPA: hypothetical protein VGF52_05630 [Tepidisphaeraceae bacterium]|jgi:hypothetical protein
MYLLAEFVETSPQEIKQGYGGLIFMGLFFLGLLILGIWWLKRGA